MKTTADLWLLFSSRMLRLFSFGLVSVILVIYLAERGLSKTQIGLLLSLTLVGDVVVSLWITLNADSFGRKRMLTFSALLIIMAGLVFVLTNDFFLLLLAAIIGVISPSGGEIGPFLAMEQAALSHIIPDHSRTRVFAWYHLCGYLATALGSLFAGVIISWVLRCGGSPLDSHRAVIFLYPVLGLMMGALFTQLSGKIEVSGSREVKTVRKYFGLHDSRAKVFKLSALFAVDAFGGGFILQSILAYWFYVRFQVDPVVLGGIFFGMNTLAGVSGLLAARLASRFGLINTMVFTHLPSNVLLILVPLMPNLPWAIAILLLRSVVSQMDVPTRQSYTMAVVSPDERSAAAGITNIARTLGAAASPILAMPMLSSAGLLSVPFFLAGGLKIVYDLLLYRCFKSLKPIEETKKLSTL